MRRTALLAMTAGALTLASCDDGGDGASLREAERRLASLNVAGPDAPKGEARLSAYRAVRSALGAESGSETQRAAGRALLAQVDAGEARLAAERAARLDREALLLLGELETTVDRRLLWRRARAEAASAFDPSAQIAELDASIESARGERETAAERLEGLESRVAELESRASALEGEASELRAEESSIRSEATQAEPERRSDLVQEAYEVQRRADGEEREAARLRARIASLDPEVEEARREIEGIDRRISLLRSSREALREQKRQSERRAEADRAAASEAAQRVEEMAARLDDLRAGALAEAYDEAAAKFGSATSMMRRSSAAGVAAQGAAIGAVEQSLGDLMSSRAAGIRVYAALLERLAGVEPALEARPAIVERLEAANERLDAATEARARAYEQAASSLSRGARGEAGERLRTVAEALRAKAQGEPEAPEPGGAQEPGASGGGAGGDA